MTNLNPSTNLENIPVLKEPNLFQRYLGIIVSPTEMFKRIVEKPRILIPLIFMIVASILPILAAYPTFSDTIRKSILLMNDKQGMITSDADINSKVAASIWYALLSTPVIALFSWLVGSSLLFGISKLFNGKGTFKEYLSVTVHTYIISFVYIVLTTILSFFTHRLGLDLSLSKVLKLFIPELKGFADGMLKGVSFFKVWEYIVIGIGIAAVSKLDKVRINLIILLAFVLHLLYLGYGELMGQIFTR